MHWLADRAHCIIMIEFYDNIMCANNIYVSVAYQCVCVCVCDFALKCFVANRIQCVSDIMHGMGACYTQNIPGLILCDIN